MQATSNEALSATGAALSCFDAQQHADELLRRNAILYEKIAKALDCPREEVAAALREALRFMHLAASNTQGKLTPSVRVDLAWHEFILCTKAYDEFCQEHFGKFVHHYPGGDERENQAQFRRTLAQYERQFGAPPADYWCTAEHCGMCES